VHLLHISVLDCALLCIDCAHSCPIPKWKIVKGFSGARGKYLVVSGTSDCALYFVTLYVQKVLQKQLKKQYFGSLFLDSSIFVVWTCEKFDS